MYLRGRNLPSVHLGVNVKILKNLQQKLHLKVPLQWEIEVLAELNQQV
jgi:hypothetical protein